MSLKIINGVIFLKKESLTNTKKNVQLLKSGTFWPLLVKFISKIVRDRGNLLT